MRMALLIGGILGAYVVWPHIEADERMIWAALLPAVYFAGMFMLFGGRS